ncbi:MAG: biotin--[acetyl-CoA-carboxylase] ligase [Beggiatoa sp. IS2]|nr:MAG: biotin--[acetyl-CoA-carboxylase] ligase [Beggiatoa sp. IS2]
MTIIADSSLNRERILTELARLQQNRPALPIQLEVLEKVDSTNHYALLQPEQRATYVCLAEQQTAGRGRLDRRWISPYASGLYLSLRQPYPTCCYPFTGLSIAIAIAVVKGLHHLGAVEVGIKWPNDLWWQRQKLGGLLLESRSVGGQIRDVVVGIGINVQMPATEMKLVEQAWVDLATILDVPVSRNQLAALLIVECMQVLTEYPQVGLEKWMADWQRFDQIKGQSVTLLTQADEIKGIAQGIDETGALWLQTNQGLQRYGYGEVSIR